jgi:hypothetical protein
MRKIIPVDDGAGSTARYVLDIIKIFVLDIF